MKNTNYFHHHFLRGLAVVIVILVAGIAPQALSAQSHTANTTAQEKANLNLTDFNCDLPPGWNDPIITGMTFILAIDGDAQILINGQQMNPWDVVGAFYRDYEGVYKCGGFGCLSESGGFGFVLFGDDRFTPEKDGFETGDPMVFKVHSWTCDKTFIVDSIAFDDLNPGTNIVYPPVGLVITYMSCTTKEECQITASNEVISDKVFFKAGQWNMCSSIKSKMPADEFLALFGNNLIAVRESGKNKMIWPEMNIFTLTGLEPGKEYQVKVSEDCWVELQ